MSVHRSTAPKTHGSCRDRTEIVVALFMAGALNAAAWGGIFSLAFLVAERYG